jgi:Mor family transcriptional regulator
MNKTIEYAVNEALNMGRLSAMPQFLEAELREKIAQEIEEKRKPYGKLAHNEQGEDRQFYLGICNGMNFAKVIVENIDNGN